MAMTGPASVSASAGASHGNGPNGGVGSETQVVTVSQETFGVSHRLRLRFLLIKLIYLLTIYLDGAEIHIHEEKDEAHEGEGEDSSQAPTQTTETLDSQVHATRRRVEREAHWHSDRCPYSSRNCARVRYDLTSHKMTKLGRIHPATMDFQSVTLTKDSESNPQKSRA